MRQVKKEVDGDGHGPEEGDETLVLVAFPEMRRAQGQDGDG